MSTAKIRVWDPFVRLFHWSLVTCFFIAYLSGEEESMVHIYSGYAVIGLVIARLVWGFIGSKYARFSRFFYSPASLTRYLKDFAAGRPEQSFPGMGSFEGWSDLVRSAVVFHGLPDPAAARMTRSELAAPGAGAELEVLDLDGLTLLPGLIDAHAHINGVSATPMSITATPRARRPSLSARAMGTEWERISRDTTTTGPLARSSSSSRSR